MLTFWFSIKFTDNSATIVSQLSVRSVQNYHANVALTLQLNFYRTSNATYEILGVS